MRRYQVNGYVLRKGIARPLRDVFIAEKEDVARRLYHRDHNVVRIDTVVDVTDADTGWTHVAFVRSTSEPDRTHEIRQNVKSSVVACGCKEYQFCRGMKTCHHIKALSIAAVSSEREQTVSVTQREKVETFVVTRRAISLAPLTMQSMQRPVEPLRAASRLTDPFGIDNDHEAFRLLDLIDAEFRSDPKSVQCFDLRVVQRVKDCVEKRKRMEQRGDVPPVLIDPVKVSARRMR